MLPCLEFSCCKNSYTLLCRAEQVADKENMVHEKEHLHKVLRCNSYSKKFINIGTGHKRIKEEEIKWKTTVHVPFIGGVLDRIGCT